jgi:hypothetical protein
VVGWGGTCFGESALGAWSDEVTRQGHEALWACIKTLVEAMRQIQMIYFNDGGLRAAVSACNASARGGKDGGRRGLGR